MKWMIASDLHGSALWTGRMLDRFEKEQPDRLLLLGDLLYHGPRNDLPEGYRPKEVIEQLSSLRGRILAVRGNCEAEVDQMVLPFPVLADYALVQEAGRLLFVTHGHLYNLSQLPPLCPGDILLHGHTHVPAWQNFGEDSYYLNPGSVSLPKDGTRHSYMILEAGCFLWKDLDGTVYHELDLG